MTNHFLGSTRFSLYEPASPSWRLSRQVGQKNSEEYLAKLYSPARMDRRVEIFFDYTLPIINKGSHDHNLVHVVSFSEELPSKYLEHLANASKKYSWLHLDKRTANKRKGKPIDSWAKKSFKPGDIYAEYRLDDDDLVATSYYDTVAKYLTVENVGSYVSLGLGLQAFYDNGAFREPRVEHRPKIAIGLARVCAITEDRKIDGPRRAAHTQVDRYAPVIIDSQQIQFLHSIHFDQDSGVDKPDGDLGNRFRNYLNQPKPDSIPADAFPNVPFEKIEEPEQIKMLIGAHANLRTVRATLKKIGRRLSNIRF
ncbi:glycosyltransferase [Corynebacterium sp. Marseille-P3884]|uniref:glycosyltransferase n=1 Tax=Corynebacterium sp. Marseille-P3884 TaxID=2495409 RepID=UPI001B340E54|nr:glycosyltransferase [Corynebacterium sp. Marseille-P3884]MBP3947849.1 hypothetical protein [Corynebacterium sp. Marseille-P3884]